VPRLVYLRSARDDLIGLLDNIARESGNRDIARGFVGALRARCRRLASLPGTLGQPRPELGAEIRSTPHRGYVIFFRYGDDRLEIINILAASRDIDGFFA